MAKHYLDFVGLNTFIYEPAGWSPEEQFVGSNDILEKVTNGYSKIVAQNTIGSTSKLFNIYQISHWKNYLFSHELPTTASFFPALMLKRNGPYGFATWKQTRVSENPLSRKQRKENIFTHVVEPGPDVLMNNSGRLNTLRGKYGELRKFVEAPVSSRYKPFVIGAATVTSTGSLERFELVSSYGNETAFFNNNQANNYYNKTLKKSEQYEQATGYYLNGGLEKDGSPIDVFEYLKYSECVYPPRVYQYKNYVRQRTTFSFPWRDEREDRNQLSPVDDGFGNTVYKSDWVLDANSSWPLNDQRVASNEGTVRYAYSLLNHLEPPGDDVTVQGYGILQNNYSFASHDLENRIRYGAEGLDTTLGVAPLYNRKHMLSPSSSVVSPNGMVLEGINSGGTFGNMDYKIDLPSGEAKWEAGSQSGLNPFYDSYDKYVDGIRQKGKDYTIIPEFRISDHVETYQTKGVIEEVADLFSLAGALNGTTDSSNNNFYKIYSTSEFMKHFEVVKKDHKEFVEPMSITLKCKALKKFLPYEGFYPAQRSVDLSKQFYDSYKDFTSTSGSAATFGDSATTGSTALFQNVMTPMFAPGIFFNTIKSGVAVDYPLINSNVTLENGYVTGSLTDGFFLKNPNSGGVDTFKFFDRRLPFEAILEPEKHLVGNRFYCNEPHIYANNSGSAFVGVGANNLYKLMAHNFISETNEFFLKNKRYTTISSRPSSDPNVGFAEGGKRYTMRVKMYKSIDSSNLPQITSSFTDGFFSPPQYGSSSHETFTMYSRPSAFGPPQYVSSAYSPAGETYLGNSGENYAYTPPYYYGEAWADITFVATESRKYSIEEIIASSSVFYSRYADITTTENVRKTYFINGQHYDWSDEITQRDDTIAMNLNASVNLFSQQIDADNSVDPNNPTTRWTIQTKFETPMLNFNHLSASDSITLPNNASQSVPRGMWHQYGRIEEDSTKGIFLQVDNVPDDYVVNYMGETPDHESLVDLCGFSTEAARLGEIADFKTVSEAIVAVPFVEQNGERFFFRISRNDVARTFGTVQEQNLVGESVHQMLRKIRNYVLPPPLDFINNPEIDPFAMYVFEFKHTFTKQDLANIWQNLNPEIGETFEVAESSISHQLLAHELLGGGAVLNNDGRLDTNAVGNEIPDRVRWMVFKVKQRGKINYYEKIYGREDALSDAVVSSQGRNVEVSYNWPYDYFSLVELAKLEVETKFAKRPINDARKDVIAPIIRTDLPTLVGNVRTETGLRSLFDQAITGDLPTPDDIPQPIVTGGEEYLNPSLGAAFNASINEAYLEGNAQIERLTPGAANNPYGDTPIGDLYYNVQAGLGEAGSVGIPMGQDLLNQFGGSAGPQMVTVRRFEGITNFSANQSFISMNRYQFRGPY